MDVEPGANAFYFSYIHWILQEEIFPHGIKDGQGVKEIFSVRNRPNMKNKIILNAVRA